MPKKSFLVLVFASIVAVGVFAQTPFSFSLGGGPFFSGGFGGGYDLSAEVNGFTVEATQKMPYFGGGLSVFFDLTYAELAFSFFASGGEISLKSKGSFGAFNFNGERNEKLEYTIMSCNIGLLGKYPFAINNKMTIFPLFGIDYQIVFYFRDVYGKGYEGLDGKGRDVDFSALWFKLGAGFDFSFTKHIFLKTEALYGIRLPNKFEKDIVDYYNEMIESVKLAGGSGKVSARLGHGLAVKAAIGYRF